MHDGQGENEPLFNSRYLYDSCFSSVSNDQHRVAVAVKAISLANRFLVGAL